MIAWKNPKNIPILRALPTLKALFARPFVIQTEKESIASANATSRIIRSIHFSLLKTCWTESTLKKDSSRTKKSSAQNPSTR